MHSKGQYERQFKKWGFRKNFTALEWKNVHRRVEKRTTEQGKKSVISHAGRLISAKKVLKAKRHDFLTTQELFRLGLFCRCWNTHRRSLLTCGRRACADARRTFHMHADG
jgi:hypothetical protein